MFGDFLDKDERYARCDEFLAIVRALWTGEPVDLRRRAPARRGRACSPSSPTRCPEIYFGGSSPAAAAVAAGTSTST